MTRINVGLVEKLVEGIDKSWFGNLYSYTCSTGY